MESVGYLDKDDTDVITHGQQQFFEILCLSRSSVTEYAAGYFYDLGNLRAEQVLNIFYCVVGIFNYIM